MKKTIENITFDDGRTLAVEVVTEEQPPQVIKVHVERVEQPPQVIKLQVTSARPKP